MKRTKILATLAVGCTAACAFALAACGEKAHEHDYKDKVVAPTCTEQGYTEHVCDCGDIVKDTYVNALGHADEHHDAQAATCVEKGWNAYVTCSRDDCTYTTKEELPVDPDAHNIEHHDAQAATCVEKGWNAYDTCSNVGCTYTTKEELPIAPDAHDIEHHEAKASNCTEHGWNAYDTCKRDGCTHSTKVELELDPDVHGARDAENKCTLCGENAFTPGLVYTLDAETDTYVLTGVDKSCTEVGAAATASEIYIASEYNGKKVTAVGNGSYLFSGLQNITAVYFPEGIKKIDTKIFYNCNALKVISIPNSIEYIKEEALGNIYGNASKIEYTEKGGVQYLGNASNPYVVAVKVNTATLVSAVTIENGTRIIYDSAFSGPQTSGTSGTSVANVKLPNTLLQIGASAFSHCQSLVSVDFGNGLKRVDMYAFEYCLYLASVKLPDSVSYIGDGAFYSCTRLVELSIPFVGETRDGTTNTYIGYIFGASSYSSNGMYGTSVRTLAITNATKLDANALRSYNHFTTLALSKSVASFGANSFNGCAALTDIYYEGTEEEWNAIAGLDTAVLPSNVTVHFGSMEIPE